MNRPQLGQEEGKRDTVRIYIDNCCFGRPFDSQVQPKVKHEAEAKLCIQMLIRYKAVDLVASSVLVEEMERNRSVDNRVSIMGFVSDYAVRFITSEEIAAQDALYREIRNTGIKEYDALHLTSAILAQCEYFITTDRRVQTLITNKITIVDPVRFMRLWEGLSDV